MPKPFGPRYSRVRCNTLLGVDPLGLGANKCLRAGFEIPAEAWSFGLGEGFANSEARDSAGSRLGTFKDCGAGDRIDALVLEMFRNRPIPIVSGVPIGHGRSNRTVPLGIAAQLDTVRRELKFVEPTFTA